MLYKAERGRGACLVWDSAFPMQAVVMFKPRNLHMHITGQPQDRSLASALQVWFKQFFAAFTANQRRLCVALVASRWVVWMYDKWTETAIIQGRGFSSQLTRAATCSVR